MAREPVLKMKPSTWRTTTVCRVLNEWIKWFKYPGADVHTMSGRFVDTIRERMQQTLKSVSESASVREFGVSFPLFLFFSFTLTIIYLFCQKSTKRKLPKVIYFPFEFVASKTKKKHMYACVFICQI